MKFVARRNILKWLSIAALTSGQASAQQQFTKPIRLIIPGPPGGASDTIARILSEDITRALGQPLVIEPRPGVGGNLATDMVAKAAPDGHTVLLGDIGPLAINVTLFPSLPFDPVRDFEPIARLAVFPWIVVAHPSLGAKSLKELFEIARKSSAGISFATPGQGTPMHLTGALLAKTSGANFLHIPYKGGAPGTLDVVAGHVKVGIVGLPPAAQHVKNGSLIPIGVSTGQRSALLPEVPTLQEAGLSGFDAGVWYGFLAPKGSPKPLIDKFSAAVQVALSNPASVEKMRQSGVSPSFLNGAEFASFIEAEGKRWGPLVKASGAKVE